MLSGGVVAISLILMFGQRFLAQTGDPLSTMRWEWGWMAEKENVGWFVFKNFGFYLIVYWMALGWWVWSNKKSLYGWVGLLMAVWWWLPMLVSFQPWAYDNTKLFSLWYILSAPLVASFLVKFVLRVKVIGVILIILIIFSGVLDMWRLSVGMALNRNDIRYMSQSKEAIALAEFLKTSTNPALTVVSIDKFDNPAMVLAGRPVILGFRGWLWTYGIDYSKRLEDLRLMLSGRASNELLDRYNVGYLVVYTDKTDLVVDQARIAEQYLLIYNQNSYLVYARK